MARRRQRLSGFSRPRQARGGMGFAGVGVIIAAAMIAYPPWHIVAKNTGITIDAGYSFIWEQPLPGASIDYLTLVIQIAVTVMALVALSVILRRG